MIHIRETTEADLIALAECMREEDKAEVYAAEGKSPLRALQDANKVSRDTYTAWDGDDILCSLGIIPLTLVGGTASPWFLSSTHLPKHPRALLFNSRHVVDAWAGQYDLLVNWVDARYTKSIRWLRKLGFTIHDPLPYGYSQLPFHMFERRSK